ncbi:MAG: aminoacyl-histidine dipeptidase [Oscillospiraceae bacterium]|nr:aminoacyl-histidine dipeptidase [Oscillospiraceae bacterium]
MMVLSHLEPEKVLGFFEEICSVPHGSGNTALITEYCVNFARERGLEHYSDELGNVIIIKPATAGRENDSPVIIQGHIDMVCQKEASCEKDMTKEGLDLEVNGDFISARGTTLGGDDGIAVAMALAVLDSSDLSHPRVEAVFTVDEETGMYGAQGIDLSMLHGHTLLNIDSEEEGIFTVSCAGGSRANCIMPISREKINLVPITVSIGGLLGGHSGVEIDKGRANASILMGRLLAFIADAAKVRLVSLSGGSADNAIPSACEAVVAVDAESVDLLIAACDKAADIFRNEYFASDKDVTVSASIGDSSDLAAVTEADTQKIITALVTVPNGIQEMSRSIEGLVETSLNLGILKLEEDHLRASFSIRSSVSSRKAMLKARLERLFCLLGGSVSFTGDYPAWEYRADSPLRDMMVDIYTELFGTEPKVVAIHAGLECGLLSEKIENLDCVSFGPNLYDIHTPAERMSIASVQRSWKFLIEILKRIK